MNLYITFIIPVFWLKPLHSYLVKFTQKTVELSQSMKGYYFYYYFPLFSIQKLKNLHRVTALFANLAPHVDKALECQI